MPRRQRITLGERVRSLRGERGLSIRALARAAAISPTYLAQLERDQSLPTEQVVFRLAKALEFNEDELLALTNRIAEDLRQIILKQPREIGALLLALDGLPAQEVEKLTRRAEQRKAEIEQKD